LTFLINDLLSSPYLRLYSIIFYVSLFICSFGSLLWKHLNITFISSRHRGHFNCYFEC